MSNEIAKIFDDSGERFGIVIDWSSKNMKPYLNDLMKRYINYEIATSVATIIISLLICIICIFVGVYLFKYSTKKYEENKESDWGLARFVISMVIIAIVFIVLLITTREVFDVITCCTFPEKKIIDYIQRL